MLSIMGRNLPLVKWIIRPKGSLLCTPLAHSKSLCLCSSSTLLFLAGQLILDDHVFATGTLPESTWSIHAQNLASAPSMYVKVTFIIDVFDL